MHRYVAMYVVDLTHTHMGAKVVLEINPSSFLAIVHTAKSLANLFYHLPNEHIQPLG